MIRYKMYRICQIVRGYIYSRIFYTNGLLIGKNFLLNNKKNFYLGKDISIEDNVSIISNGIVKLSDGANIGADTTIRCYPVDSKFEVGKNFTCGRFCFFGAAGGITIGNDVLMAQNIRIHAQNHNYDNRNILIRDQGTTKLGVKIGNDCWIGSGAVILDGVTIGQGCVIGANTTVTKDVEPYSIVVGNPGKIIKKRNLSN